MAESRLDLSHYEITEPPCSEFELVVLEAIRAQASEDTLRKRVEELDGALVWCSGSSDFAPGGIAEAGWNKVCRPLLQALGGAGGEG